MRLGLMSIKRKMESACYYTTTVQPEECTPATHGQTTAVHSRVLVPHCTPCIRPISLSSRSKDSTAASHNAHPKPHPTAPVPTIQPNLILPCSRDTLVLASAAMHKCTQNHIFVHTSSQPLFPSRHHRLRHVSFDSDPDYSAYKL
jgi:hypothetical protein